MSRRNRKLKFQSNFGKNTYSSSASRKPRSNQSIKSFFTDIFDLNTKNVAQKLVLLGLSIGTIGLGLFVGLTVMFSLTLPDVSSANSLMGTNSTVIYDRNGKVLQSVVGEEDRSVVKSEDIPQLVKDAAVAIEDSGFYKHNGFDVPALTKAVLSEFGIGRRRGGSTITQQLIKNSVLSSERTYNRKLKELVLAVKLEQYFTKDEILTMYLNRIPYGGTAYGVEKASEIFFDKDTKDLNLVEAAILASIPNAPTYYSPFGDNKYSKLLVTFSPEELSKSKIKKLSDLRREQYSIGLIGNNVDIGNGTIVYIPGRVDNVLARMRDLKMITEEERAQAVQDSLTYEFNNYSPLVKDAFHFVEYVKDLLAFKYGKDLVLNGGLRITTTLDLDLQKDAQSIVNQRSLEYVSRFGANNAAALTVDPTTGEVLAMVGNVLRDGQIVDFNNIVTARKQVGSTMKSFVYAAGFAKTLPSPGTIIFDVPIQKVGDKFRKNFDGTFKGPMTIREALGLSRNIPALKMYTIAGGQVELINYLEKLGIKSINRTQDYGDSLALGAADIPMIELVQAYGVFANDGKFVEINPILEVRTADGKVLEDNRDRRQNLEKAKQVISVEEAFMINDILSDQSVNFSDLQALPNNRPVASKTGTSTKPDGAPSDLWIVGYTKQKVTAVWVGNSNGAALRQNATGVGAAMPIWNSIMTIAAKNDPVLAFEKPASIQRYKFSKLSGDLPSGATPANMIGEDYFMPNLQPTTVDTSYFKATVDIRNKKATNSYCPDMFVQDATFWNFRMAERYSPDSVKNMRHNEILAWFNGLDEEGKKTLKLGDNVVLGFPSEEESDFCKRSLFERSRSIEITNLTEGQGVARGVLPIVVNASAASGISKIEYFLNDSIQHTYDAKVGGTMNGSVRISPAFADGRELFIKVILFDEYGYQTEKILKVYVGENFGQANDIPSENTEENGDRPSLTDILRNRHNPGQNQNLNDLNIVIE